YDNYYYSTSGGKITYTLNLSITVDDAKVAQKVQDYLLTTDPRGTLSPRVSFSKAKKEQLQDQVRTKAEKNARFKADQSAKNLGFKVDEVKSVKDGNLGSVSPYYGYGINQGSVLSARESAPHLDLQPGQNDLSYSVKVVFYIR
ncbi:MAG TPA: SIMPL domain-containing protein, partial [Candidatus Saccharimonadales bacterium]|nr:SIMPL domain-containing protein [Candidatus Saccharimonadales bacterium]